MIWFIIAGLCMSVLCSLIGLMVTANMEGVKRAIIATLISLICGYGICGLLFLEKKGDETIWNEGYCDCGGKWELNEIEHIRNGGDLYYYTCDNCNSLIRTHSHFRQKED